MIDVDEDIKQAYEKSTTQVDKIILNGQSYIITNVEYLDDVYENGNIIGTAIARSLEFEIENIIDLENKEFEYQTGIYVGNKIKWSSLGNFITQDIEPNDTTNIAKITATDYMLKTNIEYKSQLDYSSNKITLLDVMEESCSQSGLELATRDFVNNDFIVDSNQFVEGTLNRQVFQAVAQISGTFAKIRNDNKVHLVTPKRKGLLVKEVHAMTVEELNMLPVEKLSDSTSKYFSANSYKELIVKRNTHPINLVSIGLSDIEGENVVLRDEESILKNGENSLIINDNPFAYTQEKREQLITALFDAVNGFEYTSYEISGQAKPYLETGDEIAVVDKEGNVCLSFLFRFNYKSPNGLESTMEAPSIIKATVNYQNVKSALEVAKRAERSIDKMNGIITDIISEQTETSNKLSQHEQTIDGITDRVSSVTEEINTAKEELKSDIDQAENNINKNLQDNYYTRTEADSKITQKADSITSEVNKSISTAKQEAINSANSTTDSKLKNYTKTVDMNSKIEQTANSITSEVNQTINEAKQEAIDSANTSTDNKLKGYYTSEQTKSLISQESDNIELSVSRKIENIQIGGTNILRNSGPYNNLDYWTNYGSVTSSIIDESSSLSGKAIKVHHENNSTAGVFNSAKKLEVGKQYSWSVWVKASRMIEVTIGQEQDGRKKVNVTTEWQKFTHTFIATESDFFAFIFYVFETDFDKTGLDVYIHSAKLEEGNKVTGWSPSPDDIATKVDLKASLELKIDRDKLISEINASADRITLTAGRLVIDSGNFQLDENGNITAIGGNIGGFKLSSNNLLANIKNPYTFTEEDRQKLINYLMGKGTLTDTEKEKYDINGDQKLSSADTLIMKKLIDGTEPSSGTLEINTTSTYKSLILRNAYGDILTSIGMRSIVTPLIHTDNINVQEELSAKSILLDVEYQTPSMGLSGTIPVITASSNGSLYLGTDSSYQELTTNLRGNTVRLYAHSGGGVYLGYSGSTAVTSDEKLKDIYEIDDRYIEFFKNLKPITYIYKDRGHRNHMGFGARQVEEALTKAGLTTEEFAGILKDKDITISADEMGTKEDIHFDELYSLRYEEFVALNTLMIQKILEKLEGVK